VPPADDRHLIQPRCDFRFVTFQPPKRRAGFASDATLTKLAEDNLTAAFSAITHFRWDPAGVFSLHDIFGFMARTHAISLSLRTRQCPLCGSEDILRSHRRGILEWTVLLLLLLRPFRCRQCSARHLTFFFRRRHSKRLTRAFPETVGE
jgi:hypothetical protein